MARNLRKFNNEAEYNSAILYYPSVSWVVSGDSFHYDKTEPVIINDKVMISLGVEGGQELVIYNCGASEVGCFTSITVNDVAVPNPNETCSVSDYGVGNVLIKYGLNQDNLGEEFSGQLGENAASEPQGLEILVPSQITAINHLPSNPIETLVIEATTPPEISFTYSDTNINAIYVPDEAVNTYKSNPSFIEWANSISPISDYQGNLPV